MAPAPTDTNWSVSYDTLRREHLFRHPPKDHTAFPALAEAIRPHVDSFNALFEGPRVLEAGLKDIGIRRSWMGTRRRRSRRKLDRLRAGKRLGGID